MAALADALTWTARRLSGQTTPLGVRLSLTYRVMPANPDKVETPEILD